METNLLEECWMVFWTYYDSRDDTDGREVLPSAACKLEAQESQKCSYNQTWRPENHGNQWYKSQPESEGPRVMSADVQVQKKTDGPAQADSKFTLPPCHPTQSVSGLDNAHPPWWRQSSLLSLLIQTLISSRTILTDISKSNVLSAIWSFLTDSSQGHT